METENTREVLELKLARKQGLWRNWKYCPDFVWMELRKSEKMWGISLEIRKLCLPSMDLWCYQCYELYCDVQYCV